MTTHPKPLEFGGRRRGGHDRALVCTPLVGRTSAILVDELATILPKAPDLIEWRIDYFNAIADQRHVLDTAAQLRRQAGSVPIILTRRSVQEGGEPVALDEDGVVDMYAALCASGCVDFVDYELGQAQHHRRKVRAVSQAHGVALITSYHNFDCTPPSSDMLDTLVRAEREGADVAKLAVMPRTPADVLRLLEATLLANTALRIPLITMSMGSLGAITRVCGWRYGSSVTFGAGHRVSAPGQISIEALRVAMAALEGGA